MFSISFDSMFLHATHEDGILGQWIHTAAEALPGGESTTIFLTHLVVDSLNIFAILFIVMFSVFFLQTYVNMDRLRDKLAKLKSVWGYVLAVLIGVISPFCSCSIVPVLLGLISVGVPMPVCLCVLTSASLLNITAMTALFTLAGTEFAWMYLVCSMVIIIASSVILSRWKIVDGCKEYGLAHCHGHEHDMEEHTKSSRVRLSLHSTWHVFRGAWFFVLLGVALTAAMEAYFPLESIAELISSNEIFSSLVAVIIGLPIHSDVFTILPILRLLQEIYLPVAMTFLLATMVVSIPGIVLLSRVLKAKVIGVYVGILASLTLAVGLALIPILA